VIRLVHGELIKLRTTRTALGFTAALGLVTLASVLLGILAGHPKTVSDKMDSVAIGSTISFLLLFFGVVGAGAEYRHRTLAPALLVAPNRAKLIAARMFAYGLGGVAIGALMLAVTFAIGLPLLASRPGPDLAGSDYVTAVGGGLVACLLCAMLGVGAGTLVAKQVPAVLGAVVYLFMLEPLVGLASEDATKYTIGQSSGAVGGSSTGTVLDWFPAFLVLLAWTVLFAVAGALVDRRRDIS
jgi:ABC-2 type transport system permease protein